MKISLRAGIAQAFSLLAIAGILTLSSCKKDRLSEPSDASVTEINETVSTEGLTARPTCLPTEIALEHPRVYSWDQDNFARERMYKIKYDLQSRPTTAENKDGDRHFTFQYDGAGNLKYLKVYDDNWNAYIRQWFFEYQPGAANSYSPVVKSTLHAWSSQTGSIEYKSIRYYNNDKKIIRIQPDANAANGFSYFFNYDAAGNLATVTAGTVAANASVFYKFKPYDNNQTAVSSHYVWQFLSGIYSKNNPSGVIRTPNLPSKIDADFTYTYGAYGYPTKAKVSENGANSGSYLVGTFPCNVIQPAPSPRPLPIGNPKINTRPL